MVVSLLMSGIGIEICGIGTGQSTGCITRNRRTNGTQLIDSVQWVVNSMPCAVNTNDA